MSRTSTALKRLGVPGLAAVTLVAGLPLFLGTAAAAPIGSLTLTPVDGNDSGAAGSCQAYFVDAAPATANTSTVGETVNVILTDSTGSATSNADFCTAPTGDVTPAAGTVISTGGPQTNGGSTDQREFVLGAGPTANNGRVVIGVTRNQPGDVTIQAYSDQNGNDQFNAGEPQVQRTTTFTAGGPAGSNTNQDAARTVEVISRSDAATATVVVNTDSDTAVEGEARTFRVAVLNVAGDRLAGATVNFDINSDGDNTADRTSTVFATTDNNGIATGTITFPVRSSAPDQDLVTFFVNQTGLNSTTGRDTLNPNEPFDTVNVAVADNAPQSNRSVTLTPETRTQNVQDNSATFTAVIDDSRTSGADTSTTGTLIVFGVTGGSGDETVTVSNPTPGGATNECTTVDNTSTTDTNDSTCTVTVTDPTPVVGQTLTVTATVRGSAQADSSTLTFQNAVADARFIVLTPETVTVAPNTAQQLSARVTDVDGNPVQGVFVRFTESGAGAFRNGRSDTFVQTNAQGVATIEVISLPGETGTMTVTASISQADTGQATQCNQAAGAGTDPQGTSLTAAGNPGTEAAGNCADSSTVTFSSTPASPTTPASPPTNPRPTTSPTGVQQAPCTVPASITLDRSTIIATGSAQITVRATPNSIVDVFAYSRPSTTYRVVRQAELGADGVFVDRIVPPTNTRLYAQQRGCNASPSIVLNVRTALSLNVVRNGVRTYTFSGDSLPARPAGLIISLYRVTNEGRQILTAQTRANGTTGDWVIRRVFTGTGRFGFVVRTGQDLQNAPGSSNVRSLLVF